MNWVFLCLAILFEVAGTVSMKLSSGFTKLIPSLLLIFFYGGSLFFLTLTLKSIDVSVAYAVWSGMGIVLITVVGFLFFSRTCECHESHFNWIDYCRCCVFKPDRACCGV